MVTDSHAAIQRDSNRLEKRPDRNLLKFNKEQCKSAALRRNSLRRQHTLGAAQLQSSSAEGDLGVLVEDRTFFREEVFKAQEQAVPTCCKTNRWGRRPAWLNRELLLGLRKKKGRLLRKSTGTSLGHAERRSERQKPS